MPARYRLAYSLLSDRPEWYELSLDVQFAALAVWETLGRDAAILFCHGA